MMRLPPVINPNAIAHKKIIRMIREDYKNLTLSLNKKYSISL